MSGPIKAIGFLAGQVGDLVMTTVALRQFKRQFPDSHLTFAIGKKYGHVAPLFRGISGVDDIHVWEAYDGWPAPEDKAFVNERKPDILFHPFPQHTRYDWYNHLHYIEETAMMLGLDRPADALQCDLAPLYKSSRGSIVTLSMFASGTQLSKTLSMDKLVDLVSRLKREGFTPVQIGSADTPIKGAEQFVGKTIMDPVILMNSARFHITVDTAFSWIASAYSIPTIGLYGANYADMPVDRICSHNPVNPNAIYLNRRSVSEITVDEIMTAAKLLQ